MTTNFFNQGAVLDEILANTKTILAAQTTSEGKAMSALTDLQAAVTALTSQESALATAVGQAVTLLQQAAAGNTVDPTDAEAAVTAINAAVSDMQTQVQNLTAAGTAPAAPSP